jgi:hypothetical protein
MKNHFKNTLLSFLFLYFFLSTYCQNQRALVIGIDTYAPPEDAQIPSSNARINWPTLDGCKNDADLMKQVIISHFSFPEKNVVEIVNLEATRNRILECLENLLKKSDSSDIAFIYYAGHGSQVKNSMSSEKDNKDESMVPVDTWKEGVSDIRDKDLAKIFNRFVDKGVKLTVIYDCCHSGSIARGIYPSKSRFIAESNYDSKDNSSPIAPETRRKSGYLIISAAQDNEFAQEQFDDYDSAHGAFTLSLVKALDQQSVTASVQNLFSGLRAILKSNGKTQEPVLAGDASRFDQTLFGLDRSKLSDRMQFPVLSVKDSLVTIQGGQAAGISVDNELSSKDGAIKLKVIRLSGITQCEAIIVSGDKNKIKPGELVEVTNWVSSQGPLLKIYIPSGKYSYEYLQKLKAVELQLKRSKKNKSFNRFDLVNPDISIFADSNKFIVNNFQNMKSGISELKDFNQATVDLLSNGKNLFISLPPVTALYDSLKYKYSVFKSIKIVNKPSDAQYILYGSIDENDQLAYGFIKSSFSVKDSLFSMPISTKLFPLTNNTGATCKDVVDSLFETTLKLSKIRGWVTITPPKNAGFFPYHLTMRDKVTKTVIDMSGVKIGTSLSLSIEADADYLSKKIDTKYIYVFTIDINGKMQLIYPSEGDGNSQNKFPFFTENGPTNKFIIYDEMEAAEPVGTDSYFLIASKEPITGYNKIFNQMGVRGVDKGEYNPLTNLLDMGNESTARGQKSATPANWNLLRLSVKTVH